MSEWYEVFGDVRGLREARVRVGQRAALFALCGGGLLALAPLAAFRFRGADALAAVAAVVALVAGLRLGRALRAARDAVWCVKLSVRRLVGYDLTRQRTAISWPDVDRVEIDGAGLLIRGRDEAGAVRRLRIPTAFSDYPRISHRVVEYAEAFGRPVYVDGRPWELLDVHTVFPFLGEARTEEIRDRM